MSTTDLITSIEAIEKVEPPVKRRAQMRRDTRRRHKRSATITIKQRSSYLCSGCEYCRSTARNARRQIGFTDDWSVVDPCLPEAWEDEPEALELTTAEVKQLEAALEEPAKVIPELSAALKQPRFYVEKMPVVLPKHLRCPDDEERPERRATAPAVRPIRVVR